MSSQKLVKNPKEVAAEMTSQHISDMGITADHYWHRNASSKTNTSTLISARIHKFLLHDFYKTY